MVTTPTVRQPSSFATFAHDRRRTRPRAAAHPGGDEDHVGATQVLREPLDVFQRGALPDLGLPPAPSPRVSFSPSCSFTGARLVRSACASVLAREIDPRQAGRDHRVDRVASASSDPDDLDAGTLHRLHHLAHRTTHLPALPLA